MALAAVPVRAQAPLSPCRGLDAEGCTALAVGAGVPLLAVGLSQPLRDLGASDGVWLGVAAGGLAVGPSLGMAVAGMPASEILPGLGLRALGVAEMAGALWLVLADDPGPDPIGETFRDTALFVLLAAPGVLLVAYSTQRDLRALNEHVRTGPRASVSLEPVPGGGAVSLRVPL